MRVVAVFVLLGLLASGCSTVPVCASNPIPGLTTVAVAPFLNLSAERSADGRRFAFAYFSELQKTPGFEVVPVGVVEQTIVENQLDLSSPADAVRLAQILNVDAVVVGAVTDYTPYYPPQVGLQIEWYSPREWTFYPGVPLECADPAAQAMQLPRTPIIRGQSPDDGVDYEPPYAAASPTYPIMQTQATGGTGNTRKLFPPPSVWPLRDRGSQGPVDTTARQPRASARPTNDITVPQVAVRPVMAYTRFFDGADPGLVRDLQDYVAWRGDLRSGGWEAHLQRSDDFIRFAMHRMILEMLSMHGGAVKTETVCRFWK